MRQLISFIIVENDLMCQLIRSINSHYHFDTKMKNHHHGSAHIWIALKPHSQSHGTSKLICNKDTYYEYAKLNKPLILCWGLFTRQRLFIICFSVFQNSAFKPVFNNINIWTIATRSHALYRMSRTGTESVFHRLLADTFPQVWCFSRQYLLLALWHSMRALLIWSTSKMGLRNCQSKLILCV